MKLFLYFLVIFNVSGLKINFGEHTKLGILDYGENWLHNSDTEKPDLRSKFLQEKSKNIKSKKRITALESVDSINNRIEYSNGIPHYKFSQNMKINDIECVENSFISMVKMEGVKYNYIRDMHWRTWREVTYPNNTKEIVCYRCDKLLDKTCEKCYGSGTWAIEENLPCPYEIFSIIDKNKICAVNYKQINEMNEKCPTVIKLSDLRDCNNPLVTKYLVKRDFRTAPERNRTSLCKERQFCEITTVYQISSNQTIFRIINSTNHVIYSRIMKFGGNNYICMGDCGVYDPVTKKISNNDKPLIVNLLDKSKKNKREYLLKKIVHINDLNKSISTTIKPFKVGVKLVNPYYALATKKREEEDIFKGNKLYGNNNYGHATTTTMSSCKKLQTTTMVDYEMDEYFETL